MKQESIHAPISPASALSLMEEEPGYTPLEREAEQYIGILGHSLSCLSDDNFFLFDYSTQQDQLSGVHFTFHVTLNGKTRNIFLSGDTVISRGRKSQLLPMVAEFFDGDCNG